MSYSCQNVAMGVMFSEKESTKWLFVFNANIIWREEWILFLHTARLIVYLAVLLKNAALEPLCSQYTLHNSKTL